MRSLDGLSIMLVEDELLIALDLQIVLEEAGASVELAEGVATGLAVLSGAQALGRLPDVAVLDVRLCDGDVFPIADRLAALGVPLLFHSGHACGADIAETYPDAVLLTKPAPPHSFLRAVAEQAV